MLGKDLHYLAGTVDLARLEFASPRLTLRTEDGQLKALYAGAYSAGARWVPRDATVPDLDVEINSAQFKQFVAGFPDDTDVRLTATPTALRLRSRTASHLLATYRSSDRAVLPTTIEPLATCDTAALLRETDLAADLAARNKSLQGATGISLTTLPARRALRLMAYNGHSALLLAQVPCATILAATSLVLPASDLVRGLGVLEGSLTLGMSIGRLVLQSASAWFLCPTENRTWPDFAALIPRDRQGWRRVVFPTAQLKAAALAARVLGAASALELEGTERGVVLRTLQSESGSWAVAVDGALDGRYYLSTDDVLFAAGLAADEVTLELAPRQPVLVRAAGRLLVLVQRAV